MLMLMLMFMLINVKNLSGSDFIPKNMSTFWPLMSFYRYQIYYCCHNFQRGTGGKGHQFLRQTIALLLVSTQCTSTALYTCTYHIYTSRALYTSTYTPVQLCTHKYNYTNTAFYAETVYISNLNIACLLFCTIQHCIQ